MEVRIRILSFYTDKIKSTAHPHWIYPNVNTYMFLYIYEINENNGKGKSRVDKTISLSSMSHGEKWKGSFDFVFLDRKFLRFLSFTLFCSEKNVWGIMPNETATSTSTNCSAWQQSSTTDLSHTTIDTPPDSAALPVRTQNSRAMTISFEYF